jgi:hypothetical protein
LRGRRCCWLLRLRVGCQPEGRERRSGDKRTTAQQQIAAFQSNAGRFGMSLRDARDPIIDHDLTLSRDAPEADTERHTSVLI